MSFINKLFNRQDSVKTSTSFKMVTDKGGGYYTWNGKIYQSDYIRSIARVYARTVGKAVAKHIRNGAYFPDVQMQFLLKEPNDIMTGQMLNEKLVTQLIINHNAFAYVDRNKDGTPLAIYPVIASTYEVLQDVSYDTFIKFYMADGSNYTFAYSDLIHLRMDFNENEILGDPFGDSLIPLMNMVGTLDQGLVQAIKNSNVIRWLLKFNGALRDEDIDKNRKKFVNDFLTGESGGGAAAIDAKTDAQQVNPTDVMPNKDVNEVVKQRIYSMFNINESIIQSNYTENQWNAFYESSIEPIIMQMADVFTIRLFNRRERGFGNEIRFETNNLLYASAQTKLGLVNLVDRSILTPNEMRDVLGYEPYEGGDEFVLRLDTGNTNNNTNSSNNLGGGNSESNT